MRSFKAEQSVNYAIKSILRWIKFPRLPVEPAGPCCFSAISLRFFADNPFALALPPIRASSARGKTTKMAERAIAAFGRVQFLFNSAGAAIRRAKFLEIDDTLMEKTFALNVNGTLYCMQAMLPHMLANRHGVIVNMASMAHRRGGPGSSIHYAAAKGAVVSMTLGVAREFATKGVRALSISPGPIKTPFQSAAQSSPELIKQFLSDVPMQRFGQPEEIGELVLFICSDACEFMTADTIYVNGGGGWR